jgi:hypothetical protein
MVAGIFVIVTIVVVLDGIAYRRDQRARRQ